MAFSRQALSHVLLTVLAVGSLVCPCPASAIPAAAVEPADNGMHHESEATDHRGHQESEARENGGCDHTECVTSCDRLSPGTASDDAPAPGTTKYPKYPVDGLATLDTGFTASFASAQSPGWVGPRQQWLLRHHETPIGRFDRLLV